MQNDFTIIRLDEIDSTNRFALEYAVENDTPEYTVIITENQTAGRGRLGKKWQSIPGKGLFFSIILNPDVPLEELSKSTMVLGLAVAHAIEQEIPGFSIQLKWPNDLYAHGRKLGGILVETVANKNGGISRCIVAGIGINLYTELTDYDNSIQHKVTSIYLETGKNIDKEIIFQAILKTIESYMGRFEKLGFKEFLVEWKGRDHLFGKDVIMVDTLGQVVSGRAEELDVSGILRVRDISGNLHDILSGDVQLAKKKPSE